MVAYKRVVAAEVLINIFFEDKMPEEREHSTLTPTRETANIFVLFYKIGQAHNGEQRIKLFLTSR